MTFPVRPAAMTVSSCKIKDRSPSFTRKHLNNVTPIHADKGIIIAFIWRLSKRISFQSLEVELVLLVRRRSVIIALKGEFTFFFIREMDVPPLGESNWMGPKKSVEVKFFTVAFFGGYRASSMTPGTHFCHSNSSHHLI